jgi:acetyl-CoA carboxylase biotin carboxylase subunit
VRVDTHAYEGYDVPPFYDSLIGKLIVWAEDRPAALGRMQRALQELEVEGVSTTRELAMDILRSDAFASGAYTTGFLADAEADLPALVRVEA